MAQAHPNTSCSRYGPCGGPSDCSLERHEPQLAGLSRRHRKTGVWGLGVLINSANIKLKYRDVTQNEKETFLCSSHLCLSSTRIGMLIGSPLTTKYHSISLRMVLVLWPRVFEWYLNGFFNDILDSLYRSMVLNGILNYR